MKTATIACLACFILALLAFCQNATADLLSVPATSFGAGTLHETFSGPINYLNAVDCPGEDKTGSWVIPGTYSDYVFSQSGVTLTSPIPNMVGTHTPEISIIKGNQYVGFGIYGDLLSGSGLIPGGTGAKFLYEAGNSSSHFGPFMLTFPGEGAARVGGYFIMLGQTPEQDRIIITAYGATGNLVGTAYAPPVKVSSWANNFFGVATSDGTPIKSIGIDYSTNNNAGNPGIANLMFVPVPEPGTAILLVLAGLFGGLFLLRRRLFHRQG